VELQLTGFREDMGYHTLENQLGRYNTS